VESSLREEVQAMIGAKMLELHGQNLERFGRIEERIIGIDGNGTGREGALQRQDKVLKAIDAKVDQLGDNVATLVTATTTVRRDKVWGVVKWLLGGIGGLGMLILGHYLGAK